MLFHKKTEVNSYEPMKRSAFNGGTWCFNDVLSLGIDMVIAETQAHVWKSLRPDDVQ